MIICFCIVLLLLIDFKVCHHVSNLFINNNQLVAYATRFFAVHLKNYMWSQLQDSETD